MRGFGRDRQRRDNTFDCPRYGEPRLTDVISDFQSQEPNSFAGLVKKLKKELRSERSDLLTCRKGYWSISRDYNETLGLHSIIKACQTSPITAAQFTEFLGLFKSSAIKKAFRYAEDMGGRFSTDVLRVYETGTGPLRHNKEWLLGVCEHMTVPCLADFLSACFNPNSYPDRSGQDPSTYIDIMAEVLSYPKLGDLTKRSSKQERAQAHLRQRFIEAFIKVESNYREPQHRLPCPSASIHYLAQHHDQASFKRLFDLLPDEMLVSLIGKGQHRVYKEYNGQKGYSARKGHGFLQLVAQHQSADTLQYVLQRFHRVADTSKEKSFLAAVSRDLTGEFRAPGIEAGGSYYASFVGFLFLDYVHGDEGSRLETLQRIQIVFAELGDEAVKAVIAGDYHIGDHYNARYPRGLVQLVLEHIQDPADPLVVTLLQRADDHDLIKSLFLPHEYQCYPLFQSDSEGAFLRKGYLGDKVADHVKYYYDRGLDYLMRQKDHPVAAQVLGCVLDNPDYHDALNSTLKGSAQNVIKHFFGPKRDEGYVSRVKSIEAASGNSALLNMFRYQSAEVINRVMFCCADLHTLAMLPCLTTTLPTLVAQNPHLTTSQRGKYTQWLTDYQDFLWLLHPAKTKPRGEYQPVKLNYNDPNTFGRFVRFIRQFLSENYQTSNYEPLLELLTSYQKNLPLSCQRERSMLVVLQVELQYFTARARGEELPDETKRQMLELCQGITDPSDFDLLDHALMAHIIMKRPADYPVNRELLFRVGIHTWQAGKQLVGMAGADKASATELESSALEQRDVLAQALLTQTFEGIDLKAIGATQLQSYEPTGVTTWQQVRGPTLLGASLLAIGGMIASIALLATGAGIPLGLAIAGITLGATVPTISLAWHHRTKPREQGYANGYRRIDGEICQVETTLGLFRQQEKQKRKRTVVCEDVGDHKAFV